MWIVRLIVGIVGGLLLGAVLGFGAAVLTMALDGSRQTDGTFGMIEVVTMAPAGAVIGMLAGVFWGLRRCRRGAAAR